MKKYICDFLKYYLFTLLLISGAILFAILVGAFIMWSFSFPQVTLCYLFVRLVLLIAILPAFALTFDS